MNKKRIGIAIAIVAILGLGFILYNQAIYSGEYVPTDDEIALRIQFDTEEDVGLLVYDYSANGSNFSGGISNADKSLIKHDELLIDVWKKEQLLWNKEQLQYSADTVELSIQFRIITEYVDPNYENVYPENLTEYLEEISFEAHFGESYSITISGDKTNGYKAVLEE